MLKIAMCEQDITPEGPVRLPGQFYRRISTHVESGIKANIFACESNGEQLIIVSLDLTSITKELYEGIKERVSRKCSDIDADKLIIAATGNLTSPGYGTGKYYNEHSVSQEYLPVGCKYVPLCENEKYMPEDEYFNFLTTTISNAIVKTWRKRANAYIAPGFGRAVVGHSSRVVYDDGTALMYGITDKATFSEFESGSETGVELLYVFNSVKNPVGVLANVSCPAQILEHCSFISSDFWGKARELIKEELGPHFVTVGLCGAAGCQSPRDLLRFVVPETKDPFLVRDNIQRPRRGDPDMYSVEGAIEIGERIADTVLRKIRKAQNNMMSDVVLKNEKKILNLPIRKVSETDKVYAKREFENYCIKANKKEFDAYDMAVLHKYAGILKRYEVQETTIFHKAEIHIARLGDIAFATNPFDLFLDYGSRIRARSWAAQTFIIQFACDKAGYIPTEKAEKTGHYSAYVASSIVGHEGGNLLVNETLEEIKRLFE